MSSLGADGAAAAQQPKPYFLSYAVDDATSVNITAEYGAISSSNQGHARSVDVQVRLGSPAEDNTHGDHRNSALTTFRFPLTDDRDAIARSLWYATNRGYARALDGYLKVKTEQQVRAKEEDSSADFSVEQPQTDLLPPAPALVVDRAAWEQRLREISKLFTQFPDIFADQVEFEATNETDYFVSSEGAAGGHSQPDGSACDCGSNARSRRHGPVPRGDLRGQIRRPPARPKDDCGQGNRDGEEPGGVARGTGDTTVQRAGHP